MNFQDYSCFKEPGFDLESFKKDVLKNTKDCSQNWKDKYEACLVALSPILKEACMRIAVFRESEFDVVDSYGLDYPPDDVHMTLFGPGPIGMILMSYVNCHPSLATYSRGAYDKPFYHDRVSANAKEARETRRMKAAQLIFDPRKDSEKSLYLYKVLHDLVGQEALPSFEEAFNPITNSWELKKYWKEKHSRGAKAARAK